MRRTEIKQPYSMYQLDMGDRFTFDINCRAEREQILKVGARQEA